MHTPSFDQHGYSIHLAVIASAHTRDLLSTCDRLTSEPQRSRAGIRSLLNRDPLFADLATSHPIRALVDPILGPTAFVTRSILFDKTPDTNWDVVWHQDTTIAVQERVDTPGFGPWSVKAAVPHVQPPASVLESMVTVRIHLDDCLEDNGPLLVVPGSHRRGILADGAIDPTVCDQHRATCIASAGGIVMMRPLILHASRKAFAPAHRRVIHLEFARDPLPGSLTWARI